MAKKKPNKEKRMQLRAQHANTYQLGFEHGYKLGYEVAKTELRKELENGQQTQPKNIAETGEVFC